MAACSTCMTSSSSSGTPSSLWSSMSIDCTPFESDDAVVPLAGFPGVVAATAAGFACKVSASDTTTGARAQAAVCGGKSASPSRWTSFTVSFRASALVAVAGADGSFIAAGHRAGSTGSRCCRRPALKM